MNKPVNFNLAKLLNSKGLPGTKVFYDNKKHYSLNSKKYTIADVIMWLYETHGIWIISIPEGISTTWCFSMFNVDPKKGRIIFESPSCDSPTEAYEKAIKYTLNNLI